MKKTILFLGIILVLIATPLFSQDKGAQDIEKYLQSHPELRSRIPTTKTPAADPRKPAGAAMEETTAPATTATPERVTVAFPTIESLIREKGILPPEELKFFGP